jgi:hypothetical protein
VATALRLSGSDYVCRFSKVRSKRSTLRRAFGTDDGGVNWLKVAGASAAGATAVASALDAIDDGNRTATLLEIGSKALSWLHKAGASYGQPKEEA